MRVVIDTNVVVSALTSKGGASSFILQKLFRSAKQNKKYNCVSVPSVLELEDVVFRERNRTLYPQFDDSDLHNFVNAFVLVSNHVNVHFLWRPYLPDAKDDMILELAVNGMASAIITFNTTDFIGVEEKFNIKVLTPGETLKMEVIK